MLKRFLVYLFGAYGTLFISCSGEQAATIQPSELTCENREAAFIDTEHPRLSWINTFDTNTRGARQTAYSIQVASSPEQLEDNRPDLWDSGKVQSDQSYLIDYAGDKLISTKTYWWRVKVWDQDNNSSAWSAPARWTMGFMSPTEWQAQWIGAPWQGEEPLPDPMNPRETLTASRVPGLTELPPPAPLLRKPITIMKEIKEAKAFVSGLGYFEFYVNGEKVGDDVLIPNQTDYGKRQDLETDRVPIENAFTRFRVMYLGYDITKQLQQGENVFGALLGNGFYNAPKTWTSSYGTPRFIGQIHIRYTDGSAEIITSDETWKVEKGPITLDLVYEGEHYDARLDQDGWAAPGFEDAAWANAVTRKAPEGDLVAHVSPTDKVMEVLTPKEITLLENGNYLVDFGEEISGWVRLNAIKGDSGQKIDIRYLSNDKVSETTGKNSYTLKGAPSESYAARFTWFVFRYAEISNWPGDLTTENVQGEAVYTDVETTAVFETSNPLLNDIQKLWWRSQTDNMHGSIASDCPNRERSPYTGDGQVAAATVMENFDAKAFYTKWIDDILYSQNPNTGYVPNAAPWQPGSGGGPPWGAAVHIIPWEYYLHYGDESILRKSFEGMKGYVTYMQQWIQENGTVLSEKIGHGGKPFRWLNLGDWAQPYELPKDNLVHTFYLWRCADITAKTAKILGHQDDYTKFSALAENTKKAFHSAFYDAEYQSYGDFGGNIFALYMGVPAEQEAGVIQSVKSGIENRNGHLDTGIFGTQFFFEVLSDYGLHDLAHTAMSKTTAPSYGWWVENGNTTFWEHWFTPGSGNHPMFGGGITWLYRKLAGMQPSEELPGYRQIIFKPQVVDDLDFVRYSNQTPYGKAGIEWGNSTQGLEIKVSVPVGSTALVYVPIPENPDSDILESGQLILADTEHVSPVGTSGNYHVFSVKSGNYHFSYSKG